MATPYASISINLERVHVPTQSEVFELGPSPGRRYLVYIESEEKGKPSELLLAVVVKEGAHATLRVEP